MERGSVHTWEVVDVATSRTGTAQYKHWRKRVLIAARDAGIAQCPHCGVHLDYTRGLARACPSLACPSRPVPTRPESIRLDTLRRRTMVRT